MVLDRGDRGLFTIWTRSFWIKIIFPVTLSPAKRISNYFDIKGCGANNEARAHESSLRQWRCGENSQRKLWNSFKMADFFLVRTASLFTLQTFGAQINWRVISRKVLFAPHRFCLTNRLFILLEQAETEIRFSMANCTFKMKMDIDRLGPRHMPNNCKNLNPPFFSLPTTFKFGLFKLEVKFVWCKPNSKICCPVTFRPSNLAWLQFHGDSRCLYWIAIYQKFYIKGTYILQNIYSACDLFPTRLQIEEIGFCVFVVLARHRQPL